MSMSYAERFAFVENATYSKQVTVALWVAAASLLRKADSTTAEKAWARGALKGPASTDVQRMVMIRVSASNTFDTDGVTDDAIQRAVNQLVPELVAGG